MRSLLGGLGGEGSKAQRSPSKGVGFQTFGGLHVGCSQNYGHLLVIDYIMAPAIWGYQKWTLILGTTQVGACRGYR